MPQPEFIGLTRALLAAGVAPRYVRRTIDELSDHRADIEADALATGLSREDAAALARAALGTDADIVAAVSARSELLQWARRWPRSARCVESACYFVSLPAAPIAYCVGHGPAIARWGVSTSLAALLTGVLLFSLQWFVTFGMVTS